jgi:hypothetical protein
VHSAADGQCRDRLERLAVRVGEAEGAVGRDHQRVAWAELMLVAVDRGHGAAGEDDEDLLAVEGVLAAVSARVEREPPGHGTGPPCG